MNPGLRTIRYVVAASLIIIGCGTNQSSLSLDSSALELENGGLDTTDEAPEFGDPSFSSEQAPDRAEGSVSAEEDVEAQRSGAKVYYLAAAWGQLRWLRHPRDPATRADLVRPMPTLWDGTLCATSPGVGVRLLRAVKFEGRTDRIMRRGPECIEWRSATLPLWDGILARVVVGANVPADASILSFTTGALSASIRSADLAGLHRLLDAGNERGDQVAMVASERPRCGGGFLQGRWLRLSARGGVLAGRLENHSGELVGHLRGIWGARRNGEQVFFAKVIGVDGAFIGRVRGSYADGQLRGVYRSRDGNASGAIFGRYTGDDGRGYFRAVHARACAERPDACRCDAAPPSASTPDAVAPCHCEAPQQ